MQKQIVVDIDRCTGCGSCELICSFTHHGEFNPLKARIHKTVFMEKAEAVPVFCFQCDEAWCARACPAAAISINKDAAGGATVLTVNEDICVGCKMCMLACPFGNIVVSEKGKAEKCNLCGGDPECVKVCRYKAIKFETPIQRILDKKQATAEKILESHKEV